ncbi:Dps family protein [Streptomyces capparidis]|jgi:starvation-inducible DNA-binding protein
MTTDAAGEVIGTLGMRLHSLNDLALTLKHVHWNVVGPHFIAVHKMLDPQVEAVRAMVDDTAERISTLGGSPKGTPGALVAERTWPDYPVGRADALEHLRALDEVYRGVIADHRSAVQQFEDLDLVSQDMLIGQLRALELFQWFVRAHLETPGGDLAGAPGGAEPAAPERPVRRTAKKAPPTAKKAAPAAKKTAKTAAKAVKRTVRR